MNFNFAWLLPVIIGLGLVLLLALAVRRRRPPRRDNPLLALQPTLPAANDEGQEPPPAAPAPPRAAPEPAAREHSPAPEPVPTGMVLAEIAIMLLSPVGDITYASPAACRLFGLAADELVGKPASRLLPPWRQGELVEELASHHPGEWETQRLIQHNKLIDVHLISRPLADDTGQPTGGRLWCLWDITQQRRQEGTLRLAGRSVDLLHEGVLISDVARGNLIVYANAAVERITGHAGEEILGRKPRFLHQTVSAHPAGAEELRQAMAERRSCHVILHQQRPDGTLFWHEISLTPLVNDQQHATHLLFLLRDVSEQFEFIQELRCREGRERTVIEQAPIAICIVDQEHRIRTVNPMLERMFGYDAEQLLQNSLFTLLPEVVWHDVVPEPPAYERRGGEFMLQNRRGEKLTVLASAVALKEPDDKPLTALFLTDITGRKRTEQALAEAKERAMVTLAAIGEGVITTNNRGVVDYLNPAAERLTGWTREDVMGMELDQVFDLRDEESRQPLSNPVERALRLDRTVNITRRALLVTNDSREFSLQITATPIHDRQQKIIGAVMVFRDVSKIRVAERRMAREAKYDELTGLRNRREFNALLNQALAAASEEGKEHVLGYLDLDKFKIINDTCGHDAGDEVLKQVAELMQAQLRNTDILARLGGDEFAILLSSCPMEAGHKIAEQIRRALEEYRFTWHGRAFELSVSIGLVQLQADSGTLDDVLKAADTACYQAKEQGRNRIQQYQPQASQGSAAGALWQDRIRQGIAENRFTLWARRSRILSSDQRLPHYYELSLTLRDDQGHYLPESSFLPMAERHQLIMDVEKWKISTLMARVATTCDPNKVYALKLATMALQVSEQLCPFILQQAERCGLNSKNIAFEINETDLTANFTRVKRLFKALKKAGFRLTIDRFGYNRGSFGHLEELAVDFLKLDAGITNSLLENHVDYILAETVSRVGQLMRLPVIATGVDDASLLAAMEEMKIDYVLGEVIDPGRPLEEIISRSTQDRVYAGSEPGKTTLPVQ